MNAASNSAAVFSIQRHALHDGPGIRTLVFLKGCTLRCLWCSNPEGQAFSPELLYRARDCTGCRRCVKACTAGAVSPANTRFLRGSFPGGRPSDGRARAVEADPIFTDGSLSVEGGPVCAGRPLKAETSLVSTDRALCTACGACVPVCPAGARAIAGRPMTAPEVLDAVLRDEVFYRSSGGGVTASGGEPLASPLFMRELFTLAGAHGIHRAVETCGHVPWGNFETVLPCTDLFLYDVKHMDWRVHLRHTGSGNDLILENLERLDGSGAGIVVRVPLIPSFNDREEDVQAIARFALSLKTRPAVQLIPYHLLGRSKYRHLEREYPVEGLGPVPLTELELLLEAARSINRNTTLER